MTHTPWTEHAHSDWQLLAAIVESSEDAIVGKNLDGIVETWNSGAEKLYGYDRREMIGQSMERLLPPDRPDEEALILRAIQEGRRFEHFETRRRRKDGRMVDVSITISPIRDRSGDIVGASHVARDIGERVALERVILQLAAIVESSEDAIVGKSLDGVVETWNAGAESLYGYSASEIVGRSIGLLLPEDRQDEEADILRRIRNGEKVRHFETVRIAKDGSPIDVSLTVSPIRGPGGAIVGASHVARDITAQKEMDMRLRETQKLESLGVLAGGIAHDFNNLLTGILGNASLAMERLPRESPLRPHMDDVIRAAERAAGLVRQLLAYAGKGRLQVEQIRLSDLVRETYRLVKAVIPSRVRVLLELEQALPTFEGDPGQLQQVVMNLTINAAEAMGESEGSVTVRTSLQRIDEDPADRVGYGPEMRSGRYIVLEVSDTGCGMDEATLARIFEPFFTTKFTGRGLGLAAVQGIVRSHRGTLNVTSAAGAGSTFRVFFPVSPEALVSLSP